MKSERSKRHARIARYNRLDGEALEMLRLWDKNAELVVRMFRVPARFFVPIPRKASH